MVPRISVVIPLYNKGPHIARAIESVLHQTFQDFEVIVINDGSTDGGVEVVKSLNNSRLHLFNQANLGVSFARNQGVKYAKADFITFLDADDEWAPEHLEIIWRLKEKFPLAGVYTTTYKIHLKSGKKKYAKYRYIPKYPFEGYLTNYFKSAAFGDPPVCSSVVGIPKNIFLEKGGFQLGENMGEDLDLWARIALDYPVAFSSRIGAIYHMDSSNRACDVCKSLNTIPLITNGKKAIANGSVPEKMLPFFKEYLAKMEIKIIKNNFYIGNLTLAQKQLMVIDTRYFLIEKLFWRVVLFLPKWILNIIFMGIKYLHNITTAAR